MTDLVVDASLLASWVLPDEDGALAESLLSDAEVRRIIGPAHLPVEVANLLLQAMRRGRLSQQKLRLARATVAELAVELDVPEFSASWRRGAGLAERYSLTAYDAAYLELAVRTEARLGTLDKALARAARAEGVELGTLRPSSDNPR